MCTLSPVSEINNSLYLDVHYVCSAAFVLFSALRHRAGAFEMFIFFMMMMMMTMMIISE